MEPLPVALKDLMEARGISVANLWVAADLGGPSGVYRYLKGERGKGLNRKSIAGFRRMAAALGVAPDYFAEYRLYVLKTILRRWPDLDRDFYDFLVERARLRGFTDDAADDVE